jgi:hypothetical protein
MERETGFEPATSTLARSHSTTELFPLAERLTYHTRGSGFQIPPGTRPKRHSAQNSRNTQKVRFDANSAVSASIVVHS